MSCIFFCYKYLKICCFLCIYTHTYICVHTVKQRMLLLWVWSQFQNHRHYPPSFYELKKIIYSWSSVDLPLCFYQILLGVLYRHWVPWKHWHLYPLTTIEQQEMTFWEEFTEITPRCLNFSPTTKCFAPCWLLWACISASPNSPKRVCIPLCVF